MCTSCVDRIFTSGPAPCPVAGCHRTLRKAAFHKPYYADLATEREVDIRARVSRTFNRRQDDFESLRDWNDYLEQVEDLTFALVEGTPKEKTEAEEKLRRYGEANRGDIAQNGSLEVEETKRAMAAQAEAKQAARLRRLEAQQEEERQKTDLQRTRMDLLDQLATTDGDANAITQQAQKVILKKSSARRQLDAAPSARISNGADDTGLTIRGLKKKVAPVAEEAYDPFGGLSFSSTRYVLQNDYGYEWLEGAKKDPRHMAGGYSLREYYARSMLEAFSGLSVFVEEEVAGRERASSATVGTAAAVAAAGGGDHRMDDVF